MEKSLRSKHILSESVISALRWTNRIHSDD